MTPDEVRGTKRARPRVRRRRRSRREFIQVIAAGAVAAVVTPTFAATATKAAAPAGGGKNAATKPAPAKSAAPPPSAAPGTAGRHEALPKEIDKLKSALADQLKVIRAFPLPPGSPMAFTFRAQRVRRKGA